MSNYLALLNYNLTRVNASTINYSTLVGSTIIASSIVSNSSINVSNIIVQTINYSTLTGSTLTAQTINYSTLTGSAMTTNAMTTNALVVNSTLTGSTLTAQTVNYSTLTGSTLTAQIINYSTLRGSTMTINTLVIASTLTVSTLIATNNPAGVITSSMISLGASTNQSYTALAQGNYSTSTNWLSTLNNLSSTKFVAMSGNAQTQLAVTQMNTVSSVYYTSTLGTSWSTISNVTGLPTATQTNYTCGAVSGNGQYGLLGTSNGGNLYITSTLTSVVGPSFGIVNPIVNSNISSNPPYIYFPFDNSIIDSRANVTATAAGTTAVPQYVTGIIGSKALYLANSTPGLSNGSSVNTALTIPYTITSYPNITVSLWFFVLSLSPGSQMLYSFSNGSGGAPFHTYIANSRIEVVITSGGGTNGVNMGTPSPTIIANTWNNFTLIFQTGGTCTAYLNGTSFVTYANVSGYGTNTINSITIGAINGGSGSYIYGINGYIDDFKLYNSATTSIPMTLKYHDNVAISNSGQYMLATVTNGGLYMSSNFGSTWSQVSAALLQAAWSLLEISSTGQYMSVYAPPVTVQPQLTGLAVDNPTITWNVSGVVWTASSSSFANSSYYASRAFNNSFAGADSWSDPGYYPSGVYNNRISTTISAPYSASYAGEYLQLQSSVPLVMYNYNFACGDTISNFPKTYLIAGSNDSTTWYPIQLVNMGSTNPFTTGSTRAATYLLVNYTGTQTFTAQNTVNVTTTAYSTSTNAYTYFRIFINSPFGGGHCQIGEWYINFTAGGQLYSTNYGAMWCNLMPANTSKLALSGSGQYTLENINTTTVTTTPKLEGLAAAIEGTWNVSGVVWTASTSSYSAAPDYYPTNVFSTNIDYSWSSGGAPYTPTYPNSGTNTVTIGVGTVYGEYLQLRNSVPLVMNSYTFMSAAFGIVQMPRNYYIVGSNDGTNWYPIQYVVGIVNPATNTKQAFTTYFNISYTGIQIITAGQVGSFYTTAYPTSGNAYTYFRIITTLVWHTTTSNVEIGKWYINFNNIFTQPQLSGLTGVSGTGWNANGVAWTVTATTTESATYNPTHAFNNTPASSWASAGLYPGGVYTTGGSAKTTSIATPYSATYAGEWLQLQSSVPLTIYSYSFGSGDTVTNSPKTFFIVGSNDGSTWYPIQLVNMGATNPFTVTFTNATSYLLANYNGTQSFTSGATATVTTTTYSTSSNAYTYFRFIANTTFGSSNFQLGEWFINFSNRLTSPQLTGLSTASWTLNNIAWIASSSTNYNNGYPAYGAFDNANPGSTWVSATNYTNATPGVATGVTSTTVITSSSTTVNGEWLQLQSSTPLQMYSYTFVSTDPGQFPNTYTIAGSNDGTTWYLIQSVTMNQNPNTVNFQSGTYIIANQSGEQIYTTSTRSATFTCTTSAHSRNSYRYFRIIAPTIWVASISFGLGEWFINFTTTTVSPQLSGLTGNTSSSTPVPTTWAANNITWTSTSSSVIGAGFQPWIAFNNLVPTVYISGSNYSWASLSRYSGGLYTGSVSTTISAPYSAPYLGEWLQIQSSVPFVIYNYSFGCGGVGNVPKTYLIAGSNDGTTWYPIQLVNMGATNPFSTTDFRPATSYLLANYTGTQTLTSAAVPAGVTVTTTSYSTSSNAYMYFRIIANTNFGDAYFELEEWFVNFTPTQYITSNYLSATSSTPYTAPVFSPALTSTNVPITSAASQTGQYMVLITNNTSGANVYYSTNYGANFTGLTIGTSTMVSCAISLDGSCITVMNATTVYQLNNNSIGFSVAVGNQAGQQNQYQNAIAIGNYAGQQNQTANSIVLNATGAALNSYVPGFYVSPIQQYGASTSSSFSLLGYGTDNQIVQTAGIIMSSSGNVGIGTTNSVYPQTIYSTSFGDSVNNPLILLSLNSYVSNSSPSSGASVTNSIVLGVSYSASPYGFAGGLISGGTTFGTNAYMSFSITNPGNMVNPLAITNANNRECMRMLGNGNVGIGTTNPAQLLDIYGSMRLNRGNPFYTTSASAATYTGGTWYTFIAPGALADQSSPLGVATMLVTLILNGGSGPWGLATSFIYSLYPSNDNPNTSAQSGAAVPTALNTGGATDYQLFIRYTGASGGVSGGIQFKCSNTITSFAMNVKCFIISY